MKEELPRPEQEPVIVYKTEEIDIPESLHEEGYTGKASVVVIREGENRYRVRPIIGMKEGLTATQQLELELTSGVFGIEDEAKDRADTIIASLKIGVVED